MRFAKRLLLASLICLASVAHPVAQAPAIQQPTGPGMFRVNPVTGVPMPLEAIESKIKNAGGTYSAYLPGATSAVAFAYGEPQVFAWRFFGVTMADLAGKRSPYVLEHLAVKDGKRYGTKDFVPFGISTSGEAIYGLDPDKKKNRGALTFVLTPNQPLQPGEYAFSLSGLITPYAGFGASTTPAEAFRIDAR